LYSASASYGEDLMMGINNVFSTEPAELSTADDVVIFLRKIGFVM